MTSPQPASDPTRVLRLLLMLVILVGAGWWALRHQQVETPPELLQAQQALQAKDLNRAVAAFDKALKAHANQPLTYLQIMQICAAEKRWDLCAAYGDRAIQTCRYASKEERALLYATLSSAYAHIEVAPHQPSALFAIQRAWELQPQDPDYENAYGYLLADNNRDLDNALALITVALKTIRASNDPAVQAEECAVEDSYGWALHRKQRDTEAIVALLQALQDVPEGAPGDLMKVIYYHLGAAYHGVGKTEDARNALKSALVYDPDYTEAKAELASLPAAPPPSPAVPANPPVKNASPSVASPASHTP